MLYMETLPHLSKPFFAKKIEGDSVMEKLKLMIVTFAALAFLLVPAISSAFTLDVPEVTQLTDEEMLDIKGGHTVMWGYTFLSNSPMGNVNVNINGSFGNCYIVSNHYWYGNYFYESDDDSSPSQCLNLPPQTYSVQGNKYWNGRMWWSQIYYVNVPSPPPSGHQDIRRDVSLY